MKNTTKLSAAALFSALVLGASFAGNTVSAAPGPNPDNNGKVSETGHAYVTFTKDGGSQVKHPSDPGVSYVPSNTTDITNETGSITLDAIPSSLNFGTQETTGTSQTVQLLQSEGKDFSPIENDPDGNLKDGSTTDQTTLADGKTKADRKISSNGPATSDSGASSDTTGKNDTIFTQVTNVSSNKDITWTLSATLSNFYTAGGKVDEKNNAIPGAFITMKKGSHVKDTIKDDKETWEPTTDTIDPGLTLNANTSTKIVGGTMDKGIFQQQWKVGNVTLTAPQGAPVGQYTADIAWTLEAGPAADLDAAAPVTPTGSETPDATKTPDDGTN